MKANLYLFNSSFIYNEGIPLGELYSRIQELLITINNIRECSKFGDTDRIIKYEGIYEVNIYQHLTTYQFLYDSTISLRIPRDIKTALALIIDRATTSNLNENDVRNTLRSNNESNLNGLLILHSIRLDEIDSTMIIETFEQWYKFHRCFLARNPVNETNFYNECIKYFPRIFFHHNVKTSLRRLEGGLENFAFAIIYNLTQLNDNFRSYYNPLNRTETLRLFSSGCNVEATPEGNASKKHILTFEFIDENSSRVPVCCEPHLKLSKSDSTGDTHYYYNRIYFHEGKPNIEDGKILIAHIGNHL